MRKIIIIICAILFLAVVIENAWIAFRYPNMLAFMETDSAMGISYKGYRFIACNADWENHIFPDWDKQIVLPDPSQYTNNNLYNIAWKNLETAYITDEMGRNLHFAPLHILDWTPPMQKIKVYRRGGLKRLLFLKGYDFEMHKGGWIWLHPEPGEVTSCYVRSDIMMASIFNFTLRKKLYLLKGANGEVTPADAGSIFETITDTAVIDNFATALRSGEGVAKILSGVTNAPLKNCAVWVDYINFPIYQKLGHFDESGKFVVEEN